jgi:hypothetical protein
MTNLTTSAFSIASLRKLSELKGKVKEFFTDEEIMKMVENFQLPHYVLTNPITQERTVYFISSEVNEWVAKHCIQQHKCEFEQTIEVILFNYDTHKVSSCDSVPTELSSVKDLYKLPVGLYSTPPGIYFLCLGNEIVYIGQSVNIAGRVRDHRMDKTKSFDAVYFLPCYKNNLDSLERKFIKYFKPKHNTLLVHSEEKLIHI